MKKENDINAHYHETFFNALRNKIAMKLWGQEEILPLVISFSAGTHRHDVGLTQQRGFGKAQEQLRQMGWRGKHFVGCLCR